MSQRKVITLLDDIDLTRDSSSETPAAITWRFYHPLTGELYEIDLTQEHYDHYTTELAALLHVLTAAGRRVKAKPAGRRREAAETPRPTRPADSTAIRAWARENGREVSDRGRIPATVREEYQHAMAQQQDTSPQPTEQADAPAARTDAPVYEPTAWEKKHPNRRLGRQKVEDLTDEQRFAMLDERDLGILDALDAGRPEAEIPKIHVPVQRKLLHLGMMGASDFDERTFDIAPRGTGALRRAGRR
ncbi:Lsr2 family protein [Kitasatospora purpeofusca]|uniref:histone-like nucleoid-structuring protein Lsr2 n=1 Tax=Kitasatospora purpeofusca TaxID=67352 RepID=UPI00368386CA